jgi:hypothetical protein
VLFIIYLILKGLQKKTTFIFDKQRGQGMVQKIILNFNQRIHKEHRKKEREKIFGVFQFFLNSLMDKSIMVFII